MPSTQSPAGGASAAGCAAGAAGEAAGGVSAGGVGVCAYAAGMAAAMLAAAIQRAAPVRFLYPMVALATFAYPIHYPNTNVGRRQSGAPAFGSIVRRSALRATPGRGPRAPLPRPHAGRPAPW